MITIRPYEERDIERILALQTLLYPYKEWTNHSFRWKYEENPHGQALFLVAETEHGEIIGLRGFWPRQLKCGDQLILGYQATDVGVHPDYRRQKLFTTLTKEAIKLANEAGGRFFFNFPHKLSMPGYLRLDWVLQRRLHWWTRPWPLSFSRRQVDWPSSPNANRKICVFLRDESYIEWRFHRHPSSTYMFFDLGTINGTPVRAVTTIVTRQRIQQQILVDVIGAHGADLERAELLGSIVRQTLRIGGMFTVLEGTLGYSNASLRRLGFIPLPKVGVNYVTFDQRTNTEIHPIHDFNISPGDMDTF